MERKTNLYYKLIKQIFEKKRLNIKCKNVFETSKFGVLFTCQMSINLIIKTNKKTFFYQQK